MNSKKNPQNRYFLDGMYQALESGEKVSGKFTRAGVMGYIQQFVQSSYRLEVNPLSHLRKCFPQYVWKCHTLDDTGGTAGTVEVIAESDFSWLFMADGSCVTARLKRRDKPLARCFYTQKWCVGRLFSFLIEHRVVFATGSITDADWLKQTGKIKLEDDLCEPPR